MKFWKLMIAAVLAVLCAMCVSCAKTPDGQQGEPSDNDTGNEQSGDDTQNTDGDTQEEETVTLADFDATKLYSVVDYFSLDISDYVMLGRYKNLTVSVDSANISVADSEVDTQMQSILMANSPEAKITDRVTAWGDTVVMDYVGKLDGVAFTGGTALETSITLSETNGYIPGFVDGIVGLTPGVMTQVPVTFPESYGQSDLAGKDVIFEMTVHYIVGTPELTDAFVVEYTQGELTTVEEFTASVRSDLEQDAYDTAVRAVLWQKIIENASVTNYPSDAVLYYYSYYYSLYSQYAALYGVTYDAFLTGNGLTAEYLFEYCKQLVKADLVRHAIYRAGGYECSDEEYQAELDEYTVNNYSSLRAAMISEGASDYTMEQARQYFHENFESQLRDTCLDGIVTKDLIAGATVNITETQETERAQ